MKNTIVSYRFFRYFLVSLLYFLLFISLLLLLKLLGLSGFSSVLFSLLATVSISFICNKLIIFHNQDNHIASTTIQGALYASVLLLDLLVLVIGTSFVPSKFVRVTTLIFLVAITYGNYWLFSFIFNKRFKTRAFDWKKLTKKISYSLLLCLPIIAFSYGLLKSGEKIIPGDPDYYLQIYEAFRRSVLEFHQLPFWNGWVGGGIPLFANIQFGFVSIQTPFVLIFGTVIGMKIAIVAYQVIGFFGFKQLFEKGFKTQPLRASLLAYIPIFGSFFVDRVIAGHYTFLLISLVPWLLLFYIKRKQKYSWLYFALTYSFMVWSAPHYTTIMAMLVVGIWFIYEKAVQLAKNFRKRHTLLEHLKVDVFFFLKAGLTIALLCFYRMFFVVDFIKDFPRTHPVTNEAYTGIKTGLYAIWGPDQYNNPPALASGWGWEEAATYIGIGTLVCLIIVGFVYIYRRIKKHPIPFTYSPLLLGALLITFFILGMGDFGPYSPYRLLSHFPVFDSMRVATRWLLWVSLFALFLIAAYKDRIFSRIINVILALTVCELFITGSHVLGSAYFLETRQYRSPTAFFEQEYKYNIPRPQYSQDQNYLKNYFYDENLYETTRNNLGQVIAGDSLVDTRQPNTTIRCGENQLGCNFISNNARIAYWSPTKIIIERTADGPISLNMNPGKGWMINGEYVFSHYKITEPKKVFVITNTSQMLVLEYAPKLSPSWFKHVLVESTL